MEQWHYIATKQNPADQATKRTAETDFSGNGLWFKGPEFLRKQPQLWPTEKGLPKPNDDHRELKASAVQILVHRKLISPLIEVERFSDWHRTKWHIPTKPLEIGDVVFIIDEGVMKNTWKRGIIVALNKSPKDGIVRPESADVRTANSILTRPTVKLTVLDVRSPAPVGEVKT